MCCKDWIKVVYALQKNTDKEELDTEATRSLKELWNKRQV
jgi:hypothetical protein